MLNNSINIKTYLIKYSIMSNNIETLVEKLSALTIIEAAELSKVLEEKWGVTAAVGMAAPAAQAAAEEKTEFDVYLVDAGAEKLKVANNFNSVEELIGTNIRYKGKDISIIGILEKQAPQIDDEEFKSSL
jgi:hypothetical protein